MRDAEPVPSFGTLVRDGRRRKGWSQEQLETESGVSRATISRIERELTDTPEPGHVRDLCAALDIDPRAAAVSLRYLTPDEIQPVTPLPAKMQQVLDILEDPRIADAEKENWINYLLYLRNKTESAADAG